MLIFTFRLHGLIEVTPCGNIAGAMALNRGARPISSLSFCLPPITNLLLLFLSTHAVHHSLLFFSPTLSLYRFFIINLFPPALLFSLLTVLLATPVTPNLVSLTGCFIYLFFFLPYSYEFCLWVFYLL